MTPPTLTVTVQPLAVDRKTAAQMLSMSVDSFERIVQPNVRMVREGRLRVVPVAELERWLAENATTLFEQPSPAGRRGTGR